MLNHFEYGTLGLSIFRLAKLKTARTNAPVAFPALFNSFFQMLFIFGIKFFLLLYCLCVLPSNWKHFSVNCFYRFLNFILLLPLWDTSLISISKATICALCRTNKLVVLNNEQIPWLFSFLNLFIYLNLNPKSLGSCLYCISLQILSLTFQFFVLINSLHLVVWLLYFFSMSFEWYIPESEFFTSALWNWLFSLAKLFSVCWLNGYIFYIQYSCVLMFIP